MKSVVSKLKAYDVVTGYFGRVLYPAEPVLVKIDTAIELLCGENGECTPTDVVRLCEYSQSKELLGVVVDRARFMEYEVSPRGRGFVISDEISGVKNG